MENYPRLAEMHTMHSPSYRNDWEKLCTVVHYTMIEKQFLVLKDNVVRNPLYVFSYYQISFKDVTTISLQETR